LVAWFRELTHTLESLRDLEKLAKIGERSRSGTNLVRERTEDAADSPRIDGGGARARGAGRGSARSKKEEEKPVTRSSWARALCALRGVTGRT